MEEKFEVNDKIIHDFITSRENLNKIVLSHADNVIKRFYSLDSQVYRDSILSSKIKEMLGLVSSLVLRCDDCVKYHLNQCFERKVTTGEIVEVLSVGLVVGGSIVIPHLRRAMEFWVALEKRRFNSIYQKIEEEIEKKREDFKVNKIEVRENLLRYICELCSNNIPYYNWFGFYLVNNKEDNFLYLGPYVGEATTHIKIPFGKGICGQAAQKKNTIVVDDVSGENNYLACSIKVKSELVTPILRGDLVLGEIDIDSHQLNAFSELDKEFIEKLANLIEPIL
ncbi:MAG: carboxymuconolactone decarboxylase family protein [Exilispira sp.]|jgi:AhpD family alkylhydroperoxidase|nr:carboxymuconolactone decarboxylase family protein [Exilispira sp.]